MDGYYSGPYKAPNSVLVSIFLFSLSFPTDNQQGNGPWSFENTSRASAAEAGDALVDALNEERAVPQPRYCRGLNNSV